MKRSLLGIMIVMLADAHHCYSSFATRTSMLGAGGNRVAAKAGSHPQMGASRKMHGISWRLIASLTSTA